MIQQGRPGWPARERTFGWYRVYEGFVGHKKVRAVARATGIEFCRVQTTMNALLQEASQARPRGSLADFDVYDCAANIEVPPDEVARVYAELEFREWIISDQIATWDKRQPDREDPGAADRKQASRDSLKATRQQLAGTAAQQRPIPPAAIALPPAEDHSEDANMQRMYWLKSIGRDQVAERLNVAKAVADVLVHGWLRDAKRDYVGLATILTAALDLGLDGEQFRNQVAQRIRDLRQGDGEQRPLPLGFRAV